MLVTQSNVLNFGMDALACGVSGHVPEKYKYSNRAKITKPDVIQMQMNHTQPGLIFVDTNIGPLVQLKGRSNSIFN